MILKELGNIKIHQMRVLHLYEANFGALLGIKWRQMTFKMCHILNNYQTDSSGGLSQFYT